MTETEDPKEIGPSKIPKDTAETDADVSDVETDKAVNEIVRGEGDDELKIQDAAVENAVVLKEGPRNHFKAFLSNWWSSPRKKWGTIAVVIVAVAALFIVPLSRYEILGVFMREKITVEAVDSKTGAPVSGAQVRIGVVEVDTNAKGKAILYPHAGSRYIQVSKKYYAGSGQTVLVTLSSGHNVFKSRLVALGRQVKIKVVNKITATPVGDAVITADGASAKTDTDGLATVVLPSGANVQQASVTLSGYNTTQVNVTAGGNIAQNTFNVTPTGKLYFLSNLSGTIDVVKTNLDGTGRQTVLAGTGNEDPNDTSLLASRDWKYLALLAKRSGSNASVYLIDTTNGDQLTTVDQGNATFTLIGWSGDKLIYEVNRNATISNWQPDQEALKSFDPTTGQIVLLDQTQGSGSNNNDYVQQAFGQVYLIGDQIVYVKNWSGEGPSYDVLNGKQAELDTISADGSGHHVLQSFAPSSYNTGSDYAEINIDTTPYGPNGLYISFQNGSTQSFYDYENGQVTPDTTLTSDTFYNNSYATYLLSPSGNQTFWAEQRDGENTLFTGDSDASSQKQITTLSNYNPYGWYTDNYLLVSENSNALYIMPASGGTPLKITDYYKPPINYEDYGGGYGGE